MGWTRGCYGIKKADRKVVQWVEGKYPVRSGLTAGEPGFFIKRGIYSGGIGTGRWAHE